MSRKNLTEDRHEWAVVQAIAQHASQGVIVSKFMIDMTPDAHSAILLAYIIQHYNLHPFLLSRTEWSEETGLSESQYDRSIRKLAGLKVVSFKNVMVMDENSCNGVKTPEVTLLINGLKKLIMDWRNGSRCYQ